MKFRPEIYGMIAVTGLLTGCMSYPPAEKAVTLQQFDSASEAAGQKRAAAFANGFAQALKNGDFCGKYIAGIGKGHPAAGKSAA